MNVSVGVILIHFLQPTVTIYQTGFEINDYLFIKTLSIT